LGRGLFDIAALNSVHAHMMKALAAYGGRIDAVFYCPHAPDEGCHCRKPEPGLLEQIAQRYGLGSLVDVPYIGDSLRDMQAAAAASCIPHLVCTGRHADLVGQAEAPAGFPAGTRVHADLSACVDHLLKAPAL
jgi:D-glycero-D-manno-heptose 1,7-bisphosphate phosphatase